MIEPSIIEFPERHFVGIRKVMSLISDQTPALYREFMPKRHLIADTHGSSIFLAKEYPENYFDHFDPSTVFTKMLAVEVKAADGDYEGFDFLTIPSLTYAVFVHTGGPADNSIFEYIYGDWLPNSIYKLGNRPHLDIQSAEYLAGNDKNEEICIPVVLK